MASVLGLGLVQISENTAAAWAQEAPQTTSPDSTETTTPQTTAPETTESTSTAISTTTLCTTTTTGTGTTEPCLPSTTTEDVVDAAIDDLAAITPEVVVDTETTGGTTEPNATSILATTGDAPTNVAVANQPEGDVTVTGIGTAMDVGLPTVQGARPERAGNVALFAAPNPDQVAIAVQPRETGARLMVIIRSPDDPQTYRFPVKIPAGGRLEPMAGGKPGDQNTPEGRNTTGYVVLDRHNQGVGSIAAPWEQDSEGQPVPTWYIRERDAVVQHVAHIGATTRSSPTRYSASAARGSVAQSSSPLRSPHNLPFLRWPVHSCSPEQLGRSASGYLIRSLLNRPGIRWRLWSSPGFGGVVLLDSVPLKLRGEWHGTTRLSAGVPPQGPRPGRGRPASPRSPQTWGSATRRSTPGAAKTASTGLGAGPDQRRARPSWPRPSGASPSWRPSCAVMRRGD